MLRLVAPVSVVAHRLLRLIPAQSLHFVLGLIALPLVLALALPAQTRPGSGRTAAASTFRPHPDDHPATEPSASSGRARQELRGARDATDALGVQRRP